MVASVTHAKVSTVPDSADTDDVRMSDWNDGHVVSISAEDVGAEASGAVATHDADTTAVHGITDTSALETTTGSAAKVTTHTGASDPHADRAFATSAVATHAGAADPHPTYETSAEAAGKVSAHAAASDPHADRSFTTSAVSTHEAAGDPHPTYETSTEAAAKVTTHAGAADPHGDRAFATSAVATHAGLADPHTGYLQESAAAAVATSGSASDLATGTLPIARIADNAVTYAKLQDVSATARFLGRISAGSGDAEELTATQLMNALGMYRYVVASNITHAQSNTTLANVTGLVHPISASATEVWFFEAYLTVSSASSAQDLKVGWDTMPAGTTMRWGASGAGGVTGFSAPATGTTASAMLAATATASQGTGTATTVSGFKFEGTIYGGGTAGNIQLMFAQDQSTASDLIVLAGSWMRVTKLVA